MELYLNKIYLSSDYTYLPSDLAKHISTNKMLARIFQQNSSKE